MGIGDGAIAIVVASEDRVGFGEAIVVRSVEGSVVFDTVCAACEGLGDGLVVGVWVEGADLFDDFFVV